MGLQADTTPTWRPGFVGNYGDPTNWIGGVAPSPSSTAYINSGTAILFAAKPAAAASLFLNGGTLDLNGFSAGVHLFSGLGGTVVNSGTALSTLTMSSGLNSTFSGSFLDGLGALAVSKLGVGILTLSGTSTFSGGLTLDGGGLILGNAGALGAGALTISTAATLDTTGTTALVLSGSNTQNWNADFTFKGKGSLDMGAGNVAISATRSVTVTSNTLSVGAVSGSTATTGLTKLGAGTLVIGGSNTYQGATTISAGTLQVGRGGTDVSLGAGAVVDNGIFTLNHTGTLNLANRISGKGQIIKLGTGTLTLSGVNSYTGGTTLNEGALVLGSTSALGTVAGSLTVNGGALDLAGNSVKVGFFSGTGGFVGSYSGSAARLNAVSASSGQFSGQLQDGAGGLSFEKGGAGTLILSGSNSYSGGTTLDAGGLDLWNDSALGTGAVNIAGGMILYNSSGSAVTLAANNAQSWNANFNFDGSSSLNLGTGDVTLTASRTIGVTGQAALTVGGVISSTSSNAGLTKTGTGTLILTADNTFGGLTTISKGTLQLGVGGTTGSLGTGALVNNGVLDLNRSDAFALNKTISGVGRVIMDGSGVLTLGGTNSYSGGTVINGGKLIMGNAKALGAAGSDLMANSGTLDLNGFALSVGQLTGTAGVITNDGLALAKLTAGNRFSGTFGGSFGDGAAAISFEKTGAGTLTLSGSNGFTGGATLSGGGLNLGNAYALGSGPLTIAAVTTLDNTSGAALVAQINHQNWNANFTFLGSNDLDLGNGAVLLGNFGRPATLFLTVASHTLTVGGVISESVAPTGLAKSGTGTLILANDNTYTGVTTVSAGLLQLGNGGTTGSIGTGAVVDSATLALDRSDDATFANAISGAGKFVKNGAGALLMGGTNSYSGGTMINQGRLTVGNAKALGAITGDLTVNSGTLDLHGFNLTVGLFSGTDGVVTNDGLSPSKLTTNTTKSGTYAGRLMDGGSALSFEKAGTGTLTLSGSNSFGGGTVLSGGGLNLGNASALGTGLFTISAVTTLDNTSGGALMLATNNAQNWNANFTFKGSSDLDLGTGAVLIGNMGKPAALNLTVASHTLTVGGAISSTLTVTGLTKSGTGTLILTGNSTYGGLTTVSAGVLQLGNGGTSGLLGTGGVANSATFVIDRSDNFSIGNIISGVGKFVKNGAGELTLFGPSTYSGGTMLNDGVLVLGTAQALGAASGDLTLGAGRLNLHGNNITVGLLSGTGGSVFNDGAVAAKLTTNSTKSGVFAGSLNDGTQALSFEKAGTGTLTLNGSNNFSGGATLSGGGLNLNNANALGTGLFTISAVTTLDNTSGGALALTTNNAQNWNANFTFKGSSALDLGSGAVALSATRTVTVTSSTLTVGGIISGTGAIGLTKSGTGALVLTGNNTYSGLTTISAGVLQLGNGGTSGSLGTGGVANSATFVIDRSDNFSIGNIISGAGKFIKNGAGELTLFGPSSFTGGTMLNEGALILGTVQALGASSGDLTFGAGRLDLHGNNVTVGLLSGTGGSVFNDGAVAAKLTTNSTKSGVFAGSLNDGTQALSFEKAGTGTLTLSGSSNFSGGATLSGGGLNLNNANALGVGLFTISGVTTLDNTSGGALMLATNNAQNWNANFTFKGSSDLDLGTGAVLIGNMGKPAALNLTVASHTLTVGGVISSTLPVTGLIKSGTGTLILTGNNTYGGLTTISAGVLQLGNGGTSGSLGSGGVANSATFVIDRSDNFAIGNIISGVGKFVKNGAGALTLFGPSSYTGGTILNEGALVIGAAHALGAATGDLMINSGTLDLNGVSTTIGLLSGPGGAITNGGTNSATLTTSTAKSGTFAGVLQDGLSALALEKAGAGSLTLTGSNSHTGGTFLTAGTLNLGNANALGAGPLTISGVSTLDNTTGATLLLANDPAQNWNANFTFKGSNDLDLGLGSVALSATRTVTVTAGNLTVGGVISSTIPTAGLTKAGAGVLILAGDNTYTGVTTISAGTLQVGRGGTTGSLASSSIANAATLAFNRSDALSYGGVISGRGSVVQNGSGVLILTGLNSFTGGAVVNTGTLHVGSARALGNGSVTLNGGVLGTDGTQHQINVAGSLFWNSSAKISLQIDNDSLLSDTVNVTGSLMKLDGGPFTFTLNDTDITSGSRVALLTVARGFGSLTAADFNYETDDATLQGNLVIDGKTLYFVDTFGSGVGGLSFSGATFGLLTNNYSGATLTSGNFYLGGGDFNAVTVGNLGSLFFNTANLSLVGPGSTFGAVPEPSTWLLLALSICTLPFLRRHLIGAR